MSERLTTAEVAEKLGVHQNTVKHWLGQVQIPAEKDGAGRWRFDERAIEVLEAIKQLRDQDRTFETIRRRFDNAATGDSQAPNSSTPEGQPAASGDRQAGAEHPPSMDPRALADTVSAVMVPHLVEAIASQTELAEKYSRATYTIGQLEERTVGLQAQLAASKEQVLLLGEATSERDRLSRELAEAKAKIADLEGLVARQARPWWKLF